MIYGTKECERCGGRDEFVDAFDKPVPCWECDGAGWVEDETVDDVCQNCGGHGEVRAYHGDCDVVDCPVCRGTGRGCHGVNDNAPEECRCERCTDYLADKADADYHAWKDGDL